MTDDQMISDRRVALLTLRFQPTRQQECFPTPLVSFTSPFVKEPVVGEDWMILFNNKSNNNNVNNDKEEEIVVVFLLQSGQFMERLMTGTRVITKV